MEVTKNKERIIEKMEFKSQMHQRQNESNKTPTDGSIVSSDDLHRNHKFNTHRISGKCQEYMNAVPKFQQHLIIRQSSTESQYVNDKTFADDSIV